MLRWQLTLPRAVTVIREPPTFERLEALRGRTSRALPGADDVVDQVALVVDQHLLRADGASRVAGHDVVVMKTHHLCGTTELPGQFAVPKRQ